MDELHLRNYAYIGDAVWEIYIRDKTIELTDNAKHLHEITTSKVKASYQCELLNKLDYLLTDLEKDISRRGRNLSIPVGRRQNQGEYRQATAFETLIGWWYKHDKARLSEILSIIDTSIEF